MFPANSEDLSLGLSCPLSQLQGSAHLLAPGPLQCFGRGVSEVSSVPLRSQCCPLAGGFHPVPRPWAQGTTTSTLGALGPAARADFDFFLKVSKIESCGWKEEKIKQPWLCEGHIVARASENLRWDFFFFLSSTLHFQNVFWILFLRQRVPGNRVRQSE